MKDRLLVIGAGGHARSILDIALQNGEYSDIACLDPSYPRERYVRGLEEIPIIGIDSDLEALRDEGYRHIFVALGNNRLRHELFQKAVELGLSPVNIVSRHAVVSPRAQLGSGICVMAGAVVNVNTVIGDNCIVNTRCSIDHDCHIMESCHIAPGVAISGYVRIGRGTHIGTGASVIDKISIGEWSLVGGGAAVVKDLDSRALYCGVPAKKIKTLS